MSSPLNVHHEWHRAHKHTVACVSVWFWFAGEKEEAGDKTVTLQRRYAWFHLPHRLSLSAQPTHLYVFAVISSSHLEKVAPPPPSLHLNSTLSPAFPPSLQLFRFFASFQRQWSRPPILSCFEMASARSDRESDLIEKIDELDRCGVRVCICVCTSEYVSQPSMTHTGLAHLSWSTRTMEASLNTAEGSCIYAKEGGGVRK